MTLTFHKGLPVPKTGSKIRRLDRLTKKSQKEGQEDQIEVKELGGTPP